MKTEKLVLLVCTVLLSLSITVCAQPSTAKRDSVKPSYESELNAWHAKRVEGLKRPQGWLSLVALDWLNEGQNAFESFGTLSLSKGIVSFDAAPGTLAKVGGKVFTSGVLKTDAGKERADRVEIGTKVFTIIKRGDNFAVRMWDSTAETLKNFKGIDRFPVAERWNIEARWEPFAEPKPVSMASVIAGYTENYMVFGAAVFSVNGREYRLEPVGPPTETLFFIFADRTNGKETYGAGRFLYSDPPKDGKVVLDFNKAINPPCAFTAYATCPLPPPSNSLQLRIEAGEKNFGDH